MNIINVYTDTKLPGCSGLCATPWLSPKYLQADSGSCVYIHTLCGIEKTTILSRKDLFLKGIEYVPALILQICDRFSGKSVWYPSMMSVMSNYTYIKSIYTYTYIYIQTYMHIYIYTNMCIYINMYIYTIFKHEYTSILQTARSFAKNSLQLRGTSFGKQRAVVAWRARAALWYRLRWPGEGFQKKWLKWLEYLDISGKDVDLKN